MEFGRYENLHQHSTSPPLVVKAARQNQYDASGNSTEHFGKRFCYVGLNKQEEKKLELIFADADVSACYEAKLKKQ